MGRFLLISLNVDAILEGVTIAERRKKLEEMRRGNGLSDVYTATLTRLRAQAENKSVLGLKVLMWVLNSQRPLGVEELCHALGVEIGSTDLDPENVPTLRTILSSCLGLATVEASSCTVRLVHFTLQEHLTSDLTLFNNFNNPHSTIAEVCLTYLNFGSVRGLSPDVRHTPQTIPFLDYASCFWGEHARQGMTEKVKVLALRLLDRFDEHISATQLLLRYSEDSGWGRDFGEAKGQTKFRGLHGAAFMGVVEIVAAVLKMQEWDINAGDCFGSTALTWAAERGHEAVVKMLLKRAEINPDQADIKYGQTPLLWAAAHGHQEVVKMLLEQEEVNPDHMDTKCGGTSLSWAAARGHQAVVEVLLGRTDVNPNHADAKDSRTPLSLAVRNGHEGVVKMLLGREDVKVNHADARYGATPLVLAAGKGHEGIVKVLLERGDINPDHATTEYGQTPLSRAAAWGHEGIVEILLKRKDVNPDQADIKDGRTPLSWAAGNGREGVVKMLLEREDVYADRADTNDGRTPLSWAAAHGHQAVVKVLLEQGNVNPDHPGTKNGRTPLSLAAENGNEGIVKMLLEREDVNPDRAETEYGQTPLSRAAAWGREGVVKMLWTERTSMPIGQMMKMAGRHSHGRLRTGMRGLYDCF